MFNELSEVYVYQGVVRFDDTDANGHVNNARFNAYFDEAKFMIFAAGGLFAAEGGQRTIGPVVRRAEFDYLGQLFYGDRYRVESTVEFTKPTRGVFRQELFRGEDDCVCRCVSYGLWLNFDTNRPHRLDEKSMRSVLKPGETS